ncbi:MAG TPA: helicase-related protein [Pseudorhodoplanes sp.]|nr:helicase-related protein [Pseudorhodoplanes sp.]
MTVSLAPPQRGAARRGLGVTAVLGPTNTGKTHLAIERMVAHSSGLIGLPLRLLAREVYNKVAARVGVANVALITGEEKIKPDNPRFWVSTVEAMPRDLDPAFVAIDEVQLAADFERGHVFTDRLLHRRGREETMLLGAATMRPMIEKLLPEAQIVTRPRLSLLTHSGDRKLTRLPRRSAIVAFSADEVYAIAELIRRQRGGAAVVLGALSPRTRNAQVALYQAGDVDYIVATDAIGMGLNLDVDHVAFASDRKFDGYQFRTLSAAEMAQIAGRAGRALRDGTFGTTGRCAPFDEDLVQRLESHAFDPIKVLQWRNADLDFASLGALQASLAMTPAEQGLTRAPVAEDILVLEHCARDEAIRDLATTREAVQLLWEACQVPDYRKIAPANHAELVGTLYGFLAREGKIPTDWFARQVAQADRTEGDIDTLSTRIAHVRTWTFVANRPAWLADPDHWQDVTRSIEDRLSDALHERLTARFVDRRTSVLMRRLRENTALESQISKTGEVTVEGHLVGRLEGFRFAADAAAAGPEAKALHAAAQRALASEIDMRAQKLAQADDDKFVLASDGLIRWTGDGVGVLVAGDEVMRPRVRILADEQLSGSARDMVQARLDKWIGSHIEKLLGPLNALSAAEDVTGIARGVAFQLVEALGVLERQKVADEVKGLDQPARAVLRKYGVRFGAYHIYLPALLKPAPRALAAQLFALKHGGADPKALADILQLAASGRTSMPVDKTIPKQLYRAAGYRVAGERAVRVDILERLADLIRSSLVWREGAPGPKPDGAIDGFGFTVSVAMTSLVGSSGEDFASILRSLGYRMERRPKPPEPAVAADAEAAEALPAGGAQVPGDAVPGADRTDETASVADGPSAGSTAAEAAGGEGPEIEQSGPDAAAADVAAPDAAAAVAPPAETVSESADASPAAQKAAVAAAAEPAAEQAAAEAQFIEVWRPGGRSGAERPQHRRSRRDHHRHPAQPGDRQAETAAQDGASAGAAAEQAGDASRQPSRQHERRREHRGFKHRNKGGYERHSELPREKREREPDPNSPFAKLAALKAQLEANKDGQR